MLRSLRYLNLLLIVLFFSCGDDPEAPSAPSCEKYAHLGSLDQIEAFFTYDGESLTINSDLQQEDILEFDEIESEFLLFLAFEPKVDSIFFTDETAELSFSQQTGRLQLSRSTSALDDCWIDAMTEPGMEFYLQHCDDRSYIENYMIVYLSSCEDGKWCIDLVSFLPPENLIDQYGLEQQVNQLIRFPEEADAYWVRVYRPEFRCVE